MPKWERRVLGLLALGGGFLGGTLTLALMFSNTGMLGKVLCLVALACYAWGVWCGIQMLEGSEHALRSNRWFWAVQIPLFSSPVASYLFACGAFIYVSYQPSMSNFNFTFLLGSKFDYSLLKGDKPLLFGVNLLALAVCVLLSFRLFRSEARAAIPDAVTEATDVDEDKFETR